jgi:hypothetical protein
LKIREEGALQDSEWIVGPRLLNTLLCGVPLVAAVFVWLYRRCGIAGAVFGEGMVALSPTIVAHASLATTDVYFLSSHIEYADGCVIEHKAPQVVSIEPGHDGWVVGDEPVVLIEVDFEGSTVERLGMPDAHRHA